MTFDDFNLDERILDRIRAAGFETPTAIQENAIEPILAGHDLMGLAQTGTGKTAAFLLPIFQRLLKRKANGSRALVLAPTRELAEQIKRTIDQLGEGLDLKSATIYGGVKYQPQIKAIKEGYDILVATPGRLLDHMQKGTARFAELEVLVLDEADRMFDMGFLPEIRKILKRLPEKRQNLMFSATMPWDIRRLASEILSEPVVVEIGLRAPVESVSHALYAVAPEHKGRLLAELLKKTDTGSVLVFTRTKSGAELLGRELKHHGMKAAVLQGDMPQNKRQRALDSFRSGSTRILVATDIAARGLDISDVTHVINFDMPSTVDDYTHRIGRTGRAAKSGDALTFVTHEDMEMVKKIGKVLGSEPDFRSSTECDVPAPPWDPTRRKETPKVDRRRPGPRGFGRRR